MMTDAFVGEGGTEPRLSLLPERDEMVRAYLNHDVSYVGVFFVAVRTTGIFCRPTCRPPRAPRPENVEFFGTIREALDAGYRPCKLCRPLEGPAVVPDWAADLLRRTETEPQKRWTEAELRRLGFAPERVRRWFLRHYGLTFAQWCRARRLTAAFTELRRGGSLDDVALDHGFESLSGFRDAFERAFGKPPRRRAREDCVVTALVDTPLGRMLAAAVEDGLCLFEFTDRRRLERPLARLRCRFGGSMAPGDHPHLRQVRQEIAEYFAGRRRDFSVPLVLSGTPFQETVWRELRRIPCGETISYEELARRIGQPSAVRAVSQANGANCLAILIPCHRVLGKDGGLTGYGGGLWRKRLLLALEQGRHAFEGAGTGTTQPDLSTQPIRAHPGR